MDQIGSIYKHVGVDLMFNEAKKVKGKMTNFFCKFSIFKYVDKLDRLGRRLGKIWHAPFDGTQQ